MFAKRRLRFAHVNQQRHLLWHNRQLQHFDSTTTASRMPSKRKSNPTRIPSTQYIGGSANDDDDDEATTAMPTSESSNAIDNAPSHAVTSADDDDDDDQPEAAESGSSGSGQRRVDIATTFDSAAQQSPDDDHLACDSPEQLSIELVASGSSAAAAPPVVVAWSSSSGAEEEKADVGRQTSSSSSEAQSFNDALKAVTTLANDSKLARGSKEAYLSSLLAYIQSCLPAAEVTKTNPSSDKVCAFGKPDLRFFLCPSFLIILMKINQVQ